MVHKENRKRRIALEEILQLKTRQKRDILKCALVLVTVLIAVGVDQYLSMQGLIDTTSMLHTAFFMIVVFGLAIIGGSASIDYTKQSQRIREIYSLYGLSKQDLEEYRRS
jgi:hypothetical protein